MSKGALFRPEYLTLAQRSMSEFTEKKSRFIGYAAPVESENEAREFLQEIRTLHRSATHNVYAYQIGYNNELQRSNDDGEPAGTGGRPALEAIKKAGLQNSMVVVTRYFGGILLGAPGLVRAYGKSAALALSQAGIIRRIPAEKFLLTFDYALISQLESWFSLKGYKIAEKNFSEIIAYSCLIPENQGAAALKELEDLGRGKINILSLGSDYWLEKFPKRV